jgi:hypothetical protein
MLMTQWDLLAIMIALVGSVTVMGLFWRQNVALVKENIRLRKELTELEFDRIKL